ncbi:hypothetical protein CSUI_008845, partial [Cystoisospora suis]
PEKSFLFCTVGVHPTRCHEFLKKQKKKKGDEEEEKEEKEGNHQAAAAEEATRSTSGTLQSSSCSSCSSSSSPATTADCLSKAEEEEEEEEKDCVGCFPTEEDVKAARLSFAPSEEELRHLRKLSYLIEEKKDRVAAVGELGLDACRTQFCDLETQQKCFELQLLLSEYFKLPLFLHMRDAEDSFC